MNMELIYEYGSRAGVLAAPPDVYRARDARHRVRHRLRDGAAPGKVLPSRPHGASRREIASHGCRWIDYRDRERTSARTYRSPSGRSGPAGRPPGAGTRAASPQHAPARGREGGFLYFANSYADELPYWRRSERGQAELSSCPTRWTPTTCVSPSPRASTPATISPLPQTPSTCSIAEGARTATEDDVDRSALPARRQAGTRGSTRALPRLRPGAQRVWVLRGRVDIARHWLATHPHQEIDA